MALHKAKGGTFTWHLSRDQLAVITALLGHTDGLHTDHGPQLVAEQLWFEAQQHFESDDLPGVVDSHNDWASPVRLIAS
jgi:hypothetical protein